MEALDPEIHELADGLVTRALQSGTVEFMNAIGNVVPITMISRLIGFRVTTSTSSGARARSVVDGVLTASEAAGILTILLSVGGESTTSLLGNAVHMLAEDPQLQEHLRQNLDLVPVFVEEALRLLESPFRYMMRTVPADTSLGGVEIPAGSTVLLLWAAGICARPSGTHVEHRAMGIHLRRRGQLASLDLDVACARLRVLRSAALWSPFQ